MRGDRGRGLPRRGTDRVEDAAGWAVTSIGLLALVLALVLGVQTYASRSEQGKGRSGRAQAGRGRPARGGP